MSWVYFANIVGSSAGPLLTGFVLLQRYDVGPIVRALAAAECSLAAVVALATPASGVWIAAVALAAAAGGALITSPFEHLFEKLQYKTGYAGKGPYKYLLQNRSGIVAVEKGPSDIVYGGGVYDGTFNVDPVHNTNGIDRAYLLGALRPDAREVLEIGLSSASWARVVSSHAAVEHLTIVEINPGYRDLLARYPDASEILHDPKVTFVDDDGRRWLNRHPERKFDFILMNMTFHWRDQATNLLSDEALRLCKSHPRSTGGSSTSTRRCRRTSSTPRRSSSSTWLSTAASRP